MQGLELTIRIPPAAGKTGEFGQLIGIGIGMAWHETTPSVVEFYLPRLALELVVVVDPGQPVVHVQP